MFRKFSEEAKKVLVNAKKEMQDLHHPYVGSEHLMLAILKNKDNDYVVKLKKYNITYKTFKDELIKIVGVGKEKSDFFLYTPLLKNVVYNAICDSEDKNKDNVDVEDLLLAIFDEGEGIAIRLIIGMGVKVEKIYNELVNDFRTPKKDSKLYVETFGMDLNKKAVNKELDPVIGRDKEIERLMEILGRRTKNNPLLLGDAGVGKTAIVEELARRIEEGRVSNLLKNKRIISVSMSNLVAGTKYRGEFEERISKIIKELEENSNIILFIDEIHTLVGAGGAEGAIDASNIFKPALARGKIKLIGATTKEEYKKNIANDKALDRRFQIINVNEPSLAVTKEILLKLKPIYENFHQVIIKEEIIDEIINLSNKFLYDRKMPDKAIDILDEVSSMVSLSNILEEDMLNELNSEYRLLKNMKNSSIINNNFKDAMIYKEKELDIENRINSLELEMLNGQNYKKVTIKDVRKTVESKSKIPVYEMKYDVLKLKTKLMNVVKNQERAIDVLLNVSKKTRMNLKKNNKPISVLFAGSTGTGKTLLAKEYAKEFLGEDNFIKIDMSEYKESHSISKIVGSPPGYVGYVENKNILEEIKDKPHAIVLLDEVDKAHKNVIELFLQILDEGKIKNSKGEEIRFDNNIIIMTYNTGNKTKMVGFNNSNLQQEKIKNRLGVEILNRIDYIVYFNEINRETITSIIKNQINKMVDNYKREGINIRINSKVISKIIDLSEYETYGARKVKRIIDNYIDSIIIDKILEGETTIKIEQIIGIE